MESPANLLNNLIIIGGEVESVEATAGSAQQACTPLPAVVQGASTDGRLAMFISGIGQLGEYKIESDAGPLTPVLQPVNTLFLSEESNTANETGLSVLAASSCLGASKILEGITTPELALENATVRSFLGC